jgi:hypothetical protein
MRCSGYVVGIALADDVLLEQVVVGKAVEFDDQ